MEKNRIVELAERYVTLEQEKHFRDEVTGLLEKQDWNELSDRFYTGLEFGTGGIRGKIGGGFNRMNPYNVERATEGLARYIKSRTAGNAKAVIAYDSRNFSPVFAEKAALVLCRHGIKVFLFSELRPTPELSFAVRQIGANAGIVITASHNPPEYNGYKVYWEDGGQIVPPHDKGIIEEVRGVEGRVESLTREEALERKLLEYIDKQIDVPYLDMIKKHSVRPELFQSYGGKCRIVYTPLHGTGAGPVSAVLKDLGLEVLKVPEQFEPDGDFPTVAYPNPEEAEAMKMAVRLGEKEQADLVMGTDPDADRLGIAVPSDSGYVLITGNQLGALLCDYLLSALTEAGRMPPNPAVVKTIVTSEIQRSIAESYGAAVFDVLTGFKYIAEKIREFESSGYQYIFGGEESYGYLVGTEVRDKDAVSAAAMTAEMALYNISKGRSVLDHLNSLYQKHGYFEEVLISKKYEGQEGKEKIGSMMKLFRESPPESIAGIRVVGVKDYLKGVFHQLNTGETGHIDLPKSNVLQFFLSDDTIISVRPSGTEPKIKFYASCKSAPADDISAAKRQVGEKIENVRKAILDLAE